MTTLVPRNAVIKLALREAFESFERVLKIDPTSAFAWQGRGFALYELAGYNEALKSFYKALKTNPSDPDTDFGKAVIYHAQRKEKEFKVFR